MKTLSVCVPVRDGGPALEATLRSILAQDIDAEVVVLDDAGTDDTAAVAASFGDKRLRLRRNDESLPVREHWNKAVSLTAGRFVKLVCPGDTLLPGAFDRQLAVMGDNGIALCASRFQVITADGAVERTDLGLPNLLGRRDVRALMRAIVRRAPADFGPTAAAVFRRQDFDRVGGFRGESIGTMHVDLLARLCAFGDFHGMPETLAAWRDSSFAAVGNLTELLRFHHRLGSEFPQYVGRGAILGGDWRLARAAAERVGIHTVATALRRTQPQH